MNLSRKPSRLEIRFNDQALGVNLSLSCEKSNRSTISRCCHNDQPFDRYSEVNFGFCLTDQGCLCEET